MGGGEGWCSKGDPNPEEVGVRRVGGSKGGGPKGGGPEGSPEGCRPRRVGGPKGGPASRGILVFEAPGRSNVNVSPSRRGFTRQPENSKRVHLSAPALQTPPKFNEKTPQREKKE